MPSRVSVHTEAHTAAVKPFGAEAEHLGLRLVQVLHPNVQMHLLVAISGGPPWRFMLRSRMERDAWAIRRVTDDHP